MVPTAAQVVESWAEPLLNEVRAADSKDDSIRAADSRPILPSHRACAKKRAAKQRPSSESARYLGLCDPLKKAAV